MGCHRKYSSDLAAAERGNDHDFIAGTKRVIQARDHFAIDEKPDVLAHAILLVDDSMAHAGIAPVKRLQQNRERFTRSLYLLLAASIGKKRTRDRNADHATVTE